MARLFGFLDDSAQDVRFAARTLLKSPAFTAVAVLSITLGIGANTAIFSMINAVMWRMLPVKEPETLVQLMHGQGASFESGMTFRQYRLLREKNQVLTDLAAYCPERFNVSIDGGIEPPSEGQMVTGTYF